MAIPPRLPYECWCDPVNGYDPKIQEAKKIPLAGKRIIERHALVLEAIIAILGCDPTAGRATVEDVIKELLTGGGANTQVLGFQMKEHQTENTGFRVVQWLTIDFDSLPKPMTLRWDQEDAGSDTVVQVYNQTDGVAIATSPGITTTGIQSLALPTGSLPTGTKLVALRHRVTGGTSKIRGATLYTGI